MRDRCRIVGLKVDKIRLKTQEFVAAQGTLKMLILLLVIALAVTGEMVIKIFL